MRLLIGFLLISATTAALVLWLAGVTPKLLLLAGALWSVYGILQAGVNGILAPLAELPAWLSGAKGGGYGEIESLEAEGKFREAADRYRTRALTTGDVGAHLRHAELLAGELHDAAGAVAELEQCRTGARLSADDDLRVGLALVRLHDEGRHDSTAALRELRRLLDRHSEPRQLQRIRAALAAYHSPLLPAAVAENQAS
ncbi:MAG: hypothetical protein ACHQXA_00780 [Gemmatimonadales bacterium]